MRSDVCTIKDFEVVVVKFEISFCRWFNFFIYRLAELSECRLCVSIRWLERKLLSQILNVSKESFCLIIVCKINDLFFFSDLEGYCDARFVVWFCLFLLNDFLLIFYIYFKSGTCDTAAKVKTNKLWTFPNQFFFEGLCKFAIAVTLFIFVIYILKWK